MSTRKHESGFQKRQKKQRIEKLVQSQKGDMDRFVFKEPQVSSVIQSTNQSADLEPATATNNISDNVVEDVPMITQIFLLVLMLMSIFHLMGMLVNLFSQIYLIQDIGILLILDRLTF